MRRKRIAAEKIEFRVALVWMLAAALSASLITYGYLASILLSRAPLDLRENQVLLVNDREYFPRATELMGSANRSIHVMMYELQFHFFYASSDLNRYIETMEEAVGRGVDVKVIMSRKVNEREVLATMRARGIDVRLDSDNTTSHNKLIIIDSKIVIIGSSDWSYASLQSNREANVIIYSEALARQLEDYFNNAWVEYGPRNQEGNSTAS